MLIGRALECHFRIDWHIRPPQKEIYSGRTEAISYARVPNIAERIRPKIPKASVRV
jgi:hypothetical protein